MNEILLVTIVAIITPILVSITTLPFLFSKTLIRLYIQDPFKFNKQTTYKYIKIITTLYLPITLLWAIALIFIQLFKITPTQNILQAMSILFITSAFATTSIYMTNPKQIQHFTNHQTEFELNKAKHQKIIVLLLSIHTVLLMGIFLGLINAIL